ncbi:uncharacterized protein B0I36DRAFT_358285 [Microdochium trichocladiopsis]|uniref:Uncharacterized protein n=1 Tax=Microdochium trichocladiopsis TaxID=1682393 RepID=A0A9P9BX01_9PEZI|nr:uncharacterized protein B0I36DRAFT_358285 [Microdochium trichocladiopsis]KAH7041085.1 hypothetical protein B0I36DRAFT_358285 [Microdochium trichocladiopsis]
MAPVVFPNPVSYVAVAAPVLHVAAVVYLTYTVVTSLATSYRALGPPQDTRSRQGRRSKLVPVFAALAVLAVTVASSSAADGAILSYRVWADQRGLKAPPSWYPHKNSLGHKDTELYLGQWLSDTPVYRDTLEIVAERSRRFWWGQQIDLATVAWSSFVAVEGRRRGIRNLPSFLTLAHLVNLSYAQNLFYLALLVTPSPLATNHQDLVFPSNPLPRWRRIRSRLFASKPNAWHPRPFIFYSSLILGLGSVFLLPYAAGTPSFAAVALLSRASTFIPVLAPYLVPTSWGKVYATPHEAYSSLTTMFRFISAMSLILHAKASAVGLAHNAPDSHYHRHSAFLPWDIDERSKWERGTTAIGKILGSISDHPAVQAVGFDVLVSAFSLGVWAATRAADVRRILASAIPGVSAGHDGKEPVPAANTSSNPDAVVSQGSDNNSNNNEEEATPARRRRQTRASTSKSTQEEAHIPGAPRPRKGRSSQRALASVPHDNSNNSNGDVSSETADQAYEPSPAEAAALQEGDILPAEELDWEAGALAWGLTALLGLGSASSGVFGAECTAR